MYFESISAFPSADGTNSSDVQFSKKTKQTKACQVRLALMQVASTNEVLLCYYQRLNSEMLKKIKCAFHCLIIN